MKTNFHNAISNKGFTLLELMVAVAIFAISMAAAVGVYIMCQKMWHATSLAMATSREGNLALARLVYGVGTNNGLRAASSIVIDSNYFGTWTGANYPPAPGDAAHFLTSGTPDGSWRVTCDNPFDGTHCIDFNKSASNIVYWMDADTTDLASRQLICNYVSGASVIINGRIVNIQLTIVRRKGWFTSTNQIGTVVMRRNM